MSKSKINEPVHPKSEREALFDAMLGPDEEISETVSKEILETFGITGEQLVNKFKTRLQERIKESHEETGEIPKPLEATLRNVREYQKEKVPKSVKPNDWVAGMFSGNLTSNQLQPSYSFRNCEEGEVSEKDKKILNDLKSELATL